MTTRNKAEKFIELANKRVNKAIKDMQLVGNLANKQNYEFTDEQARKIVKALQLQVDTVKQSFQSLNESEKNEFKL